MSTIQCEDCGHTVSTRAAACPACGAPVAEARQQAAAGAPLTTTQATSKKLKLQLLFAWAAIIVAVVWILSAPPEIEGPVSIVPALLLTGGFLWLVVTWFRIWWHHK